MKGALINKTLYTSLIKLKILNWNSSLRIQILKSSKFSIFMNTEKNPWKIFVAG
jgi:hypothetical protein